ncbi:uncharacterized protein LOC143036353 [Oratosquilla oratoria]|uniref:uncharacterized protein LOC143036353 n=1 Tax=Oratosquilla oratoria TaxID=337810 RepID=UPI003F76D13E
MNKILEPDLMRANLEKLRKYLGQLVTFEARPEDSDRVSCLDEKYNEVSAPVDMEVPQGFVVAPLLFTLLLADVGKGVRSDTVVTAYADDVALWHKSRHRRPKRDSAQHKAELRVFQSQIELVVAQLTSLGFSLSSTKTVYMPVHQVGYNRGEYPNWNHITVCGSPVKPTASARYLGVIFQRDGRWTKHIQQVSRNARRALNLVQAIRHESWSKHRATLIPIVQSLVRSRLLFGAPALHDLPPETLRNMTRIECQALRLALGLPTSVPQEQVYSEAGILPLRHRLNSIKDICLAAGLRPDDRRLVSQHQFDPVPPWDLDPPDVTPGIPGLNRDDSPHLLLMRTRELLARKYAEDFLVYTDGSVREDGRTGAGVFLQPTNESFSVKLPPTTIQTAELVAIREAVVKVINLPQPPPRVTILSDSRTSLTILQGAYYESRSELLDDILRLSTEATNLGVRLRYQWVPSHVGLHGNEMADSAAKRGALLPEEYRVVLQLTVCDAFRRIEQASWDIWESDYAATAAYRGWPTTRPMTKASGSCSLPPHISSAISRIRVNHWWTKFLQPTCTCGTEPVSFQHCLFFCPKLKDHFLPLRDLGDPSTALDRLRANTTTDSGHTHIVLAAQLTCSSPVGALL